MHLVKYSACIEHRYKDKKPLRDVVRYGYQQFSFKQDRQMLTLRNGHPHDTGVYECIISNKYGHIIRTKKWTIRGTVLRLYFFGKVWRVVYFLQLISSQIFEF